MAGVLPEGESLRRAVRWISGRREENPEKPLMALVDEAMRRFDLTPVQSEYLVRFYRPMRDEDGGERGA